MPPTTTLGEPETTIENITLCLSFGMEHANFLILGWVKHHPDMPRTQLPFGGSLHHTLINSSAGDELFLAALKGQKG